VPPVLLQRGPDLLVQRLHHHQQLPQRLVDALLIVKGPAPADIHDTTSQTTCTSRCYSSPELATLETRHVPTMAMTGQCKVQGTPFSSNDLHQHMLSYVYAIPALRHSLEGSHGQIGLGSWWVAALEPVLEQSPAPGHTTLLPGLVPTLTQKGHRCMQSPVPEAPSPYTPSLNHDSLQVVVPCHKALPSQA
jgi:hypothetical protein